MSKTTSKITVKEEVITPETAVNWLRNNTSNRPLSEKKINQNLSQMKSGKWKLTTDAIGWDTGNKLINGQHRLHAVVRYGKPVSFLVARGLDPDAFNVIDTGKNRTASDILATNGYGRTGLLSSVVRFVMTYSKGKIYESVNSGQKELGINHQDILDFVETHKKTLVEILDVAHNVTTQFKGLPARFVGGLYWQFSKLDRDASMEFFTSFASGAGLQKDDPIYQLRNKMIGNMASKKKFPDRDKLAWTILAWNHWRKKNKITKLQWAGDPDAAFPKPI